MHGDYFPGSWLRTSGGICIIDPEFCFLGTAAFDVGVMLGHLFLARQTAALREGFLGLYAASAPGGAEVGRLARRFAGVEIMRRLIGVAQLPLVYGTEREERSHRDLTRARPRLTFGARAQRRAQSPGRSMTKCHA